MSEEESLKKYYKSFTKQPRLSASEERTLIRDYREKGSDFLNNLFKSNLYLVIKEVWRNLDARVPIWDMVQNGNEGLCDALTDYDPEGPYNFKNVAILRIHAFVLNGICSEVNMIRIPMHVYSLFDFVSRRKNEYEDDYLKYQEEWKVQHDTDLNIEEIKNALTMPRYRIGIDDIELEWHNSDGFYGLQYPDECRKLEIIRQLKTLSERESDIIIKNYGVGLPHSLNFQEIGEHYNLTRERIRQIHEHTILRLRHSSRSKYIRGYLGGNGDSIRTTYSTPSENDVDNNYNLEENSYLSRRREMMWRIFRPILESTRASTGYHTNDFIDQLQKRVAEYLTEEGVPQTSFDIYNDACLIFGEVPKNSLHRAFKLSENIIAIKKGIYALKEWGYIPIIPESKSYELGLEECVRAVLTSVGEPLSISELQSKLFQQYGERCSTIATTIYGTLRRMQDIKRDFHGKYYLFQEYDYEEGSNTEDSSIVR